MICTSVLLIISPDQEFLSSVMKKVSAVETKQALISGPACAPNLPKPSTPCPTTSSRSPVPLNLSFMKPLQPSASQCPATITRPPVPLTPTVKDPPSATLQSGAVCGNPSEAIQTSPPSIQSDRHESQGIASKTVKNINVSAVVELLSFFLFVLTRTHQQLYFRNKINMLTTYKRVKDRRRATGEGRHTWEYYTQMDELFGSSESGTAPPGTIQSTLGLEDTSSERPTISQDQPAGVVMDAQPGTSTITTSQFLDAFEAHAERRTAVLESLVRPDLERWRRLKERRRRSFERKMLTSLGTIVEELKKM
ncbi:hypothetical protein ABG768_019022 [Culter alburnus]|uniref:Uncharacterized protein n=1 Tax=Culter alburnus TaxID=194366 RepID=A0AAW2AWD3_CULAL